MASYRLKETLKLLIIFVPMLTLTGISLWFITFPEDVNYQVDSPKMQIFFFFLSTIAIAVAVVWRMLWNLVKYRFGPGKLQAAVVFLCFMSCYVVASSSGYNRVQNIHSIKKEVDCTIDLNSISSHSTFETVPQTPKTGERSSATKNKVTISSIDIAFLKKQYDYQHAEINARRNQEQILNILKVTTVAFVLFILVTFFVRERQNSDHKNGKALTNAYNEIQESRVAAIIFWLLVLINAIADTRLSYNAELTSRIGEWVRHVEQCVYKDMSDHNLTWETALSSTKIFNSAIMKYTSTLITALLFTVTIWLFSVRSESVSIRGMNSEKMRYINALFYAATMAIFTLNASQGSPIQVALILQISWLGLIVLWHGPMELKTRSYRDEGVTPAQIYYAFVGESIVIPPNSTGKYLEISKDVSVEAYKFEHSRIKNSQVIYSYLSYQIQTHSGGVPDVHLRDSNGINRDSSTPATQTSDSTTLPEVKPFTLRIRIKKRINRIKKLPKQILYRLGNVWRNGICVDKSKFPGSSRYNDEDNLRKLYQKLQSIELVKLKPDSTPEKIRHLEAESGRGRKEWFFAHPDKPPLVKPIKESMIGNDDWEYIVFHALNSLPPKSNDEESDQSVNEIKEYVIHFIYIDPTKYHQRLQKDTSTKL